MNKLAALRASTARLQGRTAAPAEPKSFGLDVPTMTNPTTIDNPIAPTAGGEEFTGDWESDGDALGEAVSFAGPNVEQVLDTAFRQTDFTVQNLDTDFDVIHFGVSTLDEDGFPADKGRGDESEQVKQLITQALGAANLDGLKPAEIKVWDTGDPGEYGAEVRFVMQKRKSSEPQLDAADMGEVTADDAMRILQDNQDTGDGDIDMPMPGPGNVLDDAGETDPDEAIAGLLGLNQVAVEAAAKRGHTAAAALIADEMRDWNTAPPGTSDDLTAAFGDDDTDDDSLYDEPDMEPAQPGFWLYSEVNDGLYGNQQGEPFQTLEEAVAEGERTQKNDGSDPYFPAVVQSDGKSMNFVKPLTGEPFAPYYGRPGDQP